MTDIVWEDPGPVLRDKVGAKKKYQHILDACRANPGRWALVLVQEAGMSGNPSGNLKRTYGAPDVEWSSRKQPDGTTKVYVRVVKP